MALTHSHPIPSVARSCKTCLAALIPNHLAKVHCFSFMISLLVAEEDAAGIPFGLLAAGSGSSQALEGFKIRRRIPCLNCACQHTVVGARILSSLAYSVSWRHSDRSHLLWNWRYFGCVSWHSLCWALDLWIYKPFFHPYLITIIGGSIVEMEQAPRFA